MSLLRVKNTNFCKTISTGNLFNRRFYTEYIMRLCFLFLATLFAGAEEDYNSKRFFHDDSKAFNRFPNKASILESKLQEFNLRNPQDCNLHVITTTATSYSGLDLMQFADLKRKELLEMGRGFLLIYEIDSGKFSLSIRPLAEDSSKLDWAPSAFPQHFDRELEHAWEKRLQTNTNRKRLSGAMTDYDPVESCLEISRAFMETVEEFTVNKNLEDSSILNESNIKILIATLILLGGYVSAIMCQQRVNRKLAEEKFVCYFPVVPKPTSLGCMYGSAFYSLKYGKTTDQ